MRCVFFPYYYAFKLCIKKPVRKDFLPPWSNTDLAACHFGDYVPCCRSIEVSQSVKKNEESLVTTPFRSCGSAYEDIPWGLAHSVNVFNNISTSCFRNRGNKGTRCRASVPSHARAHEVRPFYPWLHLGITAECTVRQESNLVHDLPFVHHTTNNILWNRLKEQAPCPVSIDTSSISAGMR